MPIRITHEGPHSSGPETLIQVSIADHTWLPTGTSRIVHHLRDTCNAGTAAAVMLCRWVSQLNADVSYIVFSVQPLFMAKLAKLDEQHEHWLAVIQQSVITCFGSRFGPWTNPILVGSQFAKMHGIMCLATG